VPDSQPNSVDAALARIDQLKQQQQVSSALARIDQLGGGQSLTAETPWRRAMRAIGAPVAQEQHPTSGGLWDKLLAAGWGALKEGVPTALSAMGGVGPATRLGRIAVGTAAGSLSGLASSRGKPEAALAGAAGGVAGGVLGEAMGSVLGRAIAGNSPQQVERFINDTFRRVIKPSRIGRANFPQIGAQDRRIFTAVDQIISHAPRYRLHDAGGQELPLGAMPQSIRQFSEALDHTKRLVFGEYEQMAIRAGQQGIRVDLRPAVRAMLTAAATPEVSLLHPSLVRTALADARRFLARGSLSPLEAQDVIQNLNQTISGFYRSPSKESVSHAAMLAPLAAGLRASLDQAIKSAQGPGYRDLKLQYGALRDVEKDVAGAVAREANKIPGGIGGIFADIGATEEVMRGVLTLNPHAIATGAGLKAAKQAYRFINDPNRAIARIFARRAQPPSGSVASFVGDTARRYGAPAGGIAGGVEAARVSGQ
jgi:hypothetical protein